MLKRTILLASALAPALLLGACGGTLNRSLDSVHQPVVTKTDYAFDVATNGSRLAPGEEKRLAGWMASLRLGYGDHVAIDDPHPYGSGVHDTVAAQVAQYGLLLSDDAPVTSAPVPPGTVRIVISRMKASVPGCPDYTRQDKPEFNSNTSSNLGCAINSNLAAMVANPADLVRGQPGADSNDNISSSKAIDSYRKMPPTGGTGLKSESTGAK
jgi:pilus assembly protein CpaD